MAEVRKKEVEDKYNTSSIKIKKKETKKEDKSIKKVASPKKKDEKKEKQGLFTRIRIFFNGVKSEFKSVHWTSKQDMIKYSVSSILFIIFCSLFFYLIDIIFALVRSLFS